VASISLLLHWSRFDKHCAMSPTIHAGFCPVNSVEPVIPQFNCSLVEKGSRDDITLADLGEITVYPVRSRYTQESKLWAALLDRFHYLGSGPICGAQIRYLVKSEQGYLGALSFSSATFALACRDQYIGWTEAARRSHLDQVVCNSRFLILPQVAVPNLASHVLSLVLEGLLADLVAARAAANKARSYINSINVGDGSTASEIRTWGLTKLQETVNSLKALSASRVYKEYARA
jgi:hypothetical protein